MSTLSPSLDLPRARSRPARPAAQMRQRRRERLQMLGLVLGSYAVDTLLLLALAAIDVIDPAMPWAYAGAGVSVFALFFTLLGSPWCERQDEQFLVIPQLLVNAAVNLAFIAWVPQVGGLMLMLQFVIFAFGSLRMHLRPVLVASLVISAAVGVLIALMGERLSLPLASATERAISGLWFGLILARSALLGLYAARLRALLARRNVQLADTFDKLELLASRDELTGTLNRRSVLRLLDEERERAHRTGQPLAVALLDIDHFKQVNDQLGHLAGDEVLRGFTARVTAAMRSTDRLGRYGGEEFLMLLTAPADAATALAATERLRAAVARQDWSDVAPGLAVTFSAGVAICREGESAEHLLGRADQALYRAKRDGRDCVRAA